PRVRLQSADQVEDLLAPYQDSRAATPMGERLQRLLWEQLGLAQASRSLGVNVLHCPYLTAPLVSPAPTVVTVHDVITFILPEYRQHLMNRVYTALVAPAVRRAQAIIAVSECSARDLVRVLRVPAERVHVIPNAIDGSYKP